VSASLTFTGTGGASYTVPGTHVEVDGTWAYDSDGVGLVSSGNFARLLETTLCTGTSSCEVQFDLPATAAYWTTAAITFLDSSLNGVGVNVRGDVIVVEKIVAGSGTTTLSTLSTATSGVFTLKVELNTSTGGAVVYKNAVSVITTTYTDFLSNLRAGVTTYRDNSIAVIVNTLVTVTGGASATLDDINSGGSILVGSTGNTITTTGLGTLTTLTIGTVSATSLSATGGDGTFTMPTFVDGGTYQLLGSKTVTAGDGTLSANLTKTLAAPTNHSYVTLSGTLNTTNTGVLYNFSPAAVVGDQIVFDNTKGTVDAQGNYEGSFDGTQTMWHIKASDWVTRSYDVITGVVGVTYNIVGLSATASLGTIATVSCGINKLITGLSSTTTQGSVTGSSGGIRYILSGLQSNTSLGIITQLGAGINYLVNGLSTAMSVGTITGQSGGIVKAITGLSATAAQGTVSVVSGGIKYLVAGLQSLVSFGNVSSPNGHVPSENNSDMLPKLINKMVKPFRKSIRRFFRKK
jgi:hypothetical protein